MAIERFRRKNYYLSNMFPLENWIEADCGLMVPTSEHYYQAARLVDTDAQREVASARNEDGRHGLASKDVAYRLIEDGAEERPDWEVVKYGVMLVALMKKFTANEDLTERLVATGTEELIEGNNHGDTTWGVSPVGSNIGKNWLGRLLMEVREELGGGMLKP